MLRDDRGWPDRQHTAVARGVDFDAPREPSFAITDTADTQLGRNLGPEREALYPKLAPIANQWYDRMGMDARFPAAHSDYVKVCHEAGQTRPTPLLLKYGPGDYNRLHQDIYGDLLFPLQITVLLSQPADDFTGGEFILTEQRPRMQSRAEIIPLKRGDAVIFPVRNRPVQGARRDYRVTMRHGVSRLHSGLRHTLGIIFHDAA